MKPLCHFFALALLAALALPVLFMAQSAPPKEGSAIYQKRQTDPVMKEMEERNKTGDEEAAADTKKIEDEQEVFRKKDEESKGEFRFERNMPLL